MRANYIMQVEVWPRFYPDGRGCIDKSTWPLEIRDVHWFEKVSGG